MISTAFTIAPCLSSVSVARTDFGFLYKNANKLSPGADHTQKGQTQNSGVKCKAVARAKNFKISINAQVPAGTLAMPNSIPLVTLEPESSGRIEEIPVTLVCYLLVLLHRVGLIR
jgi:hypothetical protein